MNRNDRILLRVIAVVFCSIALAGILVRVYLKKQPSTVAVISRHNTTVYPLAQDRVIDIDTHIIEIRHFAARITHAQCKDKICEKAGWVHDGIIVCAPFKLAVIVTPQKKSLVDATTY